jgi:S-formylglutathione hydrolase
MTTRSQRIIVVVLCLLPCVLFADQPRLITSTVHGRALEGNLLGDSPDRSVTVYLPPSYFTEKTRRYPVVYLLHGWGMSDTCWTNGTFQKMALGSSVDEAIKAGSVRETIFVMPDACNAFGGSWYVNSTVAGNWEDFITRDLVSAIDAAYRTVASRNGRGIAGHSMGGYGALYIAMRHPDEFSAVYAMSPAVTFFGPSDAEPFPKEAWPEVFKAKDLSGLKAALRDSREKGDLTALDAMWQWAEISRAAAYSPNPRRPPLYVDFPYESVDGKLQKIASTWKKWRDHDIDTVAAAFQRTSHPALSIAFDCGRSNDILQDVTSLSVRLTNYGIAHVFKSVEGGHNWLKDRFEKKLLPYLGQLLSTGQ